jgi:hypothetical protein
MGLAAGPPCYEDAWAESVWAEDVWTWLREHVCDWMLSGRPYELDHEAGRVVYLSPADRALADFVDTVDRYESDGFAMVMAAALFLRRWLRDHQGPPPPPLLLRLARLVLLVLLRPAIARDPGRPEDGVAVDVPSAPLVRAHSVLTAAPPYFRAPVLAGVPA